MGLVALVILIAVALLLPSGGHRPSTSTPRRTEAKTTAIPSIEAGILPWSLDTPLSREVLLASGGSTITSVGGLNAAQASVSAIFTIDTSTGDETTIGMLAAGVHDAAGAVVGGNAYVFGGGSPTTVGDVERFLVPTAPGNAPTDKTPTPSTPSTSGSPTLPDPVGTVITGQTLTTVAPTQTTAALWARLPQPRSDPGAATIGPTTYIAGGYDGTSADSSVLATRNGRQFTTVAQLPVPVRYPAVAALDGVVYVFGGEAVGGALAGQAVTDIQAVYPTSHRARVIGHLDQPIAGAMAAVIGGNLYVAGGVAATGGSVGAASAPAAAPVPEVAIASIWAFNPTTKKLLKAGALPVATAYGAIAVVGPRAWIVGGENGGVPMTSVQMLVPNAAFGPAGMPGAGSPYYGAKLLVADRGNNRLLVLDDTGQIQWTYPSAFASAPPGGFYFPDDAFFTNGGTRIISNQEENETIVIIAFPSGQVLWQYGHPRVVGTQPGFLHEPDDAYLLKNGLITVADAQNCRVLFITQDKNVVSQIGTNGVCKHQPPDFLGSPNGDTPLADGNVLISEITGSWVSEYTPQAKLVWSAHLPVGYPSDPQQIGPNLYLLSDYSHPGAILEFNRQGDVLYKLEPLSGIGELNQPSLTELLPSGVFMANDDYRYRMVAYDPTTGALVWQYGLADHPGTAPGMLDIPDGFDLLLPDGTTPTHRVTG